MSTLEQIMNNHRIRLVSGVPDHRAIRKIETEIYGEPVSEYPGEWDEVTQDHHLERHVYRGSYRTHDYYAPRCLWCEDRRRDREAIEVQVRAEHEAMSRVTRGQAVGQWISRHDVAVVFGGLFLAFVFAVIMAFVTS